MTKFDLIVNGKFHYFEIAKELNRIGLLNKIYTTYPKSHLAKYGVPSERVKSFVFLELLRRIIHKIPFISKNLNIFQKYLFGIFINFTYKQNSNISLLFLAGNFYSIPIIKKFQKTKYTNWYVDEGSTHVLYRNSIMTQEFTKLDLRYKSDSKHIISWTINEYLNSKSIFVPSEFVKKSFDIFGLSQKINVNPYGYNFNVKPLKVEPISRSINESKINVIFVGSLMIRKGLHYLIDAIQYLDSDHFHFHLVGPMRKDIQNFVYQISSKNNVTLYGSLDKNKLNKVYQKADVLILPSIEEGLSLVQLEALSRSVPVIATKNTGSDQCLVNNENGIIIESFSSSSIILALQFIYQNPEFLKKLKVNSFKSIDKFTWENYVKNLSSLCEQ